MAKVRREKPNGLVISSMPDGSEILGQGAHARVYLGQYFKTKVAIKQYRRHAIETFKREFAFYDRVMRL